ncbi:MAG: zinc ribbon domain-containing protein [Thermoplasmata archaeon]|nr:zinc ribbon domain-containing protein [Thermoplasmata archaeon]
MYCSGCGKEIPKGAAFCPECGTRAGEASRSGSVNTDTAVMFNKKSEGVALILSLIIPGLGQMYIGQFKRGAGFLVLAILIYVLAILVFALMTSMIDTPTSQDTAALIVLTYGGAFTLAYLALWIYSMYDAYTKAKEYNAYLLQNGGQPPW